MRQFSNGWIDEFEAQRRKCSVRAAQDPSDFSWKVQGFVESTPVGAEYGVSAENVSDFSAQNPDGNLVADLMAQARQVIEDKAFVMPPRKR